MIERVLPVPFQVAHSFNDSSSRHLIIERCWWNPERPPTTHAGPWQTSDSAVSVWDWTGQPVARLNQTNGGARWSSGRAYSGVIDDDHTEF
jgi:hypothetical protein